MRITQRLPKPTYDLQTFRGDLFGGITAAVVGLPTALAFGVASGLGAIAGLYGAIVGGFCAAVFGGTRSQMSGPTGPMAVAMAVVVSMNADNLTEAFTIVVLAGVIQILLGALGIGRFVAFTPYSVISGFMTGIGVIIILLQTLPFLGAGGSGGGPTDVIRSAILLALVLGLGRYVEIIPLAALAGILMKVGYDIIDWRFITRIRRIGREHLIVMIATFGLTVFVDLITAVAIGLIVAAMAHARQFELMELDRVISTPMLDSEFLGASNAADPYAARVGIVALRGSFTVASSNSLVTTITQDIGDHEVVILDFTETVYIDDSAALVVEQLIDTTRDEDTACIIIGLAPEVAEALNSLGALDKVPAPHNLQTLERARTLCRQLLNA